MSRPMADTPKRRPRRQFTDEFKAGAVRLVLDDGKTVGAAARDLDLTETALREWVRRAQADRTMGRTGLTTAERDELARLRKENRELRTERDILNNSRGLLREAPSVRFAWIAAERAEFTVAECCRALRVSPSGFYASQDRPASARTTRDAQLRVQVRASHAASRGRYGRPRVWKDLHEAGERISQKRVGRLMREEGLRARARKRFRSTTMSEHDQPIAPNVLARQFAAERPNQRWVGDTTEFLVGSSAKVYLAAILDLYSRFIVGWASARSTIGT